MIWRGARDGYDPGAVNDLFAELRDQHDRHHDGGFPVCRLEPCRSAVLAGAR